MRGGGRVREISESGAWTSTSSTANHHTLADHINVLQLNVSVSFSFYFSFCCPPQHSPSSFASEATPPINRPRPVPTFSTLNTPLSPLSLQACALYTSAAPLYQVPACRGFQRVVPNRCGVSKSVLIHAGSPD